MEKMNTNMKTISTISEEIAPWMSLRRWLQATSYKLQALSTANKLAACGLQLAASQVSTTKINISHV